MARLLCLVLALSCINCATALNIGVGVAAVVDLHSTQVALHGGGVEANPLIGEGAVQQALAKSAGVATVIGGAWWLEHKQDAPRWANVMRVVAMAAWGAAAWHNYTLWSEQ